MNKELLNRLKSGDEIAFRECVESHKDKVLNSCYRFVQNQNDAEDLAQEVFIEVHRSIGHFREDAQLSPGFIGLRSINRWISFERRNGRSGLLM